MQATPDKMSKHQGLLAPLIIAFVTLSGLLLGGCAAKRDHYDVPALDLPKQYAKDTVPTTPKLTDELSSPFSQALEVWWRLLSSEELNGLMDRALANNPDLKIATLRIAQSKARLDQAGSSKLPTITIPISMNNTFPEYGVGSGYANGFNTSRPLSQLSIQGNYRLDIWGETSALYESAEFQLLRTTYQRDDMQRNVLANVALSYMEYLSLNDRIRVARETEKSLNEMLASVDARMEVGDATITEMEQQKAAVYSVKATIPLLEQQRNVVLNKLASLLGSSPVALKLSDNGLDSVNFPSVLPGVPSALLLRRPDVRVAEASLLAADADIDVARTRVLPPLDLTAQAGYGSTYMSQLFTPQALFWNTLESLSVTIFDSGKLSKEVEFAKAMHEELLETYVRVIYDAVREVDDSLSGIKYMSKRLELQGTATDASLRAWNYSKEVFMAGVVDYIVLLDTQRTYQLNIDNLYSFRLDNYRNLINLFSALGGGISSRDILPDDGARHTQSVSKDDIAAGKNDMSVPSATSATRPSTIGIKGVDWTGSILRGNSIQWIVELSGVYDRGAILPAWRDLRARFPQQMESRTLLPYRQGQVKMAGKEHASKERASWYRLFIATFPNKKKAEEYCATLAAAQQRCSVVSSKSLADKGDFVMPTTDEQNDKYPSNDHADTGQVKDVQQTTDQTEASPVVLAKPAMETEATPTPANSPERMIERWTTDWAEKNVEGYLSHYDIGFRPEGGKNHAAWEAERRHRIDEATSIKVRVKNLEIEQQSERMVTARFVETIEVGHYVKKSRKKLLLIRGVDGEWKISEEKRETEAEAQAARLKAKHAAKSGADSLDRKSGRQFDGVDWSDQKFWLVEMSDVYDRGTIIAAWRGLIARFPEQMKNRTVLPRSRGGVNDARGEPATNYQLFIANFSEKQMAEEFCTMLRAGQQHCSVVSSQSFAEKDGFNATPVTDQDDSKGGLP